MERSMEIGLASTGKNSLESGTQQSMDRVNCILNDEEYRAYLSAIATAEATRVFCRHDMAHFLDVCRIAMILNLELGLCLDKEMIYGAGLLHDIGRWMQYASGVDHAIASAQIAPPILKRCGFSKSETGEIIAAIASHRGEERGSPLSRIIFRADKASRMCLTCPARGACKNFLNGEVYRLDY